MHALPPQRGMASTGALSAGLLALVLLSGALVFLVFEPSASARFSVAPLAVSTCPDGSGAPVCYNATVKNVGGKAAAMRCVLTPGPGSQAVFESGSAIYLSPGPVQPTNGVLMLIKVDAASGGTITPPTISCSPA